MTGDSDTLVRERHGLNEGDALFHIDDILFELANGEIILPGIIPTRQNVGVRFHIIHQLIGLDKALRGRRRVGRWGFCDVLSAWSRAHVALVFCCCCFWVAWLLKLRVIQV